MGSLYLVVFVGSGYSFVLWCSCFLRVCAVLLLLCPLYNPVGVVLLSFCVWARCIWWYSWVVVILFSLVFLFLACVCSPPSVVSVV